MGRSHKGGEKARSWGGTKGVQGMEPDTTWQSETSSRFLVSAALSIQLKTGSA